MYGYDPTRIAAAGDSAGGHLAALLGTTAGMEDLEGQTGGCLDQRSDVACVIDFYGPTDLMQRFEKIDGAVKQLLGADPQQSPQLARRASPVAYIGPRAAPMLLIHGQDDPFVPVRESQRLHELYQRAGLASQLIVIPGARHAGPQFPYEQQKPAIRGFLAAYLGNKELDQQERPH